MFVINLFKYWFLFSVCVGTSLEIIWHAASHSWLQHAIQNRGWKSIVISIAINFTMTEFDNFKHVMIESHILPSSFIEISWKAVGRVQIVKFENSVLHVITKAQPPRTPSVLHYRWNCRTVVRPSSTGQQWKPGNNSTFGLEPSPLPTAMGHSDPLSNLSSGVLIFRGG